MNLRHCLTIVTAIFTLALSAWSILEIVRHGTTLWALAVLVYLVLVSVMLWLHHGETAANAAPAPLTPQAKIGGETRSGPQRKSPPVQGSGIGDSEKTAQEIILNAIRTKGKAKRHDLLPQVGLSRSSLGRVLDQEEGVKRGSRLYIIQDGMGPLFR